MDSAKVTKYHSEKHATVSMTNFKAVVNPGTDWNAGARQRRVGDSYLAYYNLSAIPGGGKAKKAKTIGQIIGSSISNRVSLQSLDFLGNHTQKFIDAEKETQGKILPGAVTTGGTALVTLATSAPTAKRPRHPDIETTGELKKVTDAAVDLIDNFIKNDLEKELKTKMKGGMRGGAKSQDMIVRFLQLTIAIKLAKHLLNEYDKRLHFLQDELNSILSRRTDTLKKITEPHQNIRYIRPLFSFLKYQIGNISKEDDNLIDACQQAGLPLFASLAVYLSHSKKDIENILRTYSQSSSSSKHNILHLKRLSAESKFRTCWKITSLQQLQILTKTHF